jgi:hypothetical protein
MLLSPSSSLCVCLHVQLLCHFPRVYLHLFFCACLPLLYLSLLAFFSSLLFFAFTFAHMWYGDRNHMYSMYCCPSRGVQIDVKIYISIQRNIFCMYVSFVSIDIRFLRAIVMLFSSILSIRKKQR